MKKPTNSAPPKTSAEAILEGIERGEEAIREGRTLSHNQAKEKLQKWLLQQLPAE